VSEAAAGEAVVIDSLGHRADGIGQGPGGRVFVPFTLPGERVEIERNGERGRLVGILEPSPDRVAPICRHFGRCGGCALQMMPLSLTRAFKRELVVAALRQQGIAAPVDGAVGPHPASRRRIVLTALRAGPRLLLGYNERLSHRLVDIAECPILVPPLEGRIGGIRSVAELLVRGGKPARLTALLTASGLDLHVQGAQPPGRRDLPEVGVRAQAAGIVRLSLDGEPLLSFGEPRLSLAGVTVIPPPGAFVQASAAAEALMAELVVDHLRGSRQVADLFSGLGTFAFALARHAALHAVEGSEAALAALGAAAKVAAGLRRVTTERRDLHAFPLSPAELNRYDAVVFDPPHAGAKEQAEALAASKVPRVAAVSCNPATFARDARTLLDGGYELRRVVPVDQFVFSAETEVVGLFSRPGATPGQKPRRP
jgi:23S rRNA (uracil1939-C5)-methyltransferase